MRRAFSKKNIWEVTPRFLKAALGGVLNIVPPDFFLGNRFRANLRFLQDSQWWPRQRAIEYQLEHIRRICTLAFDNTRYYRRVFNSIGFDPCDLKSVEDISHLPTIDKQSLRQHLHEMCTRSVDHHSVDYVSTGGSSGVPFCFYIQKERSVIEYAYLVSSWHRVGYKLGMPMATLRGRIVQPDRAGLYHEYDPILRYHYYSNFHMTDENIQLYLDHIANIGPCFLYVYPSSAAALVRFCQRNGRGPPRNILAIIAESETVYPDQRVVIEDVCHARLFSSYGHSEKLVLAAECEHTNDYHVWPTYGYFELLDERGNQVTMPGQRGEIVGTGFINTVIPFIRYRTGDYATYVGEGCEACGREHILIRDIQGHRIQEMLVAADGAEISWTAMNMHDDTFNNVRQCQFYQDTPGQAVLRIVPAADFNDNDRQRILKNLGQKFDNRLEFTIELTDSIPLTARGKSVYVDQRIKLEGP